MYSKLDSHYVVEKEHLSYLSSKGLIPYKEAVQKKGTVTPELMLQQVYSEGLMHD